MSRSLSIIYIFSFNHKRYNVYNHYTSRGPWAVSLWQYLFIYIYTDISDLYVFIKRQIRFIARLCKKIYRIYFRMLNYCNCDHNCPVQIISLSAPVHNYSAIYFSHEKFWFFLSLCKIWLYVDYIVHDFLRPCVNIAINFLQNLNLSLFTTDIFSEK